jgi:hypothetical protein
MDAEDSCGLSFVVSGSDEDFLGHKESFELRASSYELCVSGFEFRVSSSNLPACQF